MDFEEYQKKAKETAIYPKLNPSWLYPLIGLNGEVGEISEKLKKVLRDSKNIITEEKLNEIKKEIGDVLWYLAAISDELGLNLSSIAQENIEKLKARKERHSIHGEGDFR